MAVKRTIRQGQLVSPFGVGAIMDIGPESFAVTDISRWPADGLRRILDSRLEDKLQCPIRTPSTNDGAVSVAIGRFPKWHFCPKCRRMRRVSSAEDEARKYEVPKCEHCEPKAEMTPMGFVSVCRDGHLGDVDWHFWAHRRHGAAQGVCSTQQAVLYFETSGRGGGDWAAIRVRCGCGASNDFSGLVQVEGPGGMRCGGGQPWLRGNPACVSKAWVYRRAASNLHFPSQVSALDLAMGQVTETSTNDLVHSWQVDPEFGLIAVAHGALQDIQRTFASAALRIDRFAGRHGCTQEAAREALAIALDGTDEGQAADGGVDAGSAGFQSQILREEWAVLANGRDVSSITLQVRQVPVPAAWPAELRRTVSAVSMVRRLREVRALIGFRRLSPSAENPLVPVDLGQRHAGWYPGVEAWGEGIFIRLSDTAVRAWERLAGEALKPRLERIGPRIAAMGWDEAVATPRFLMLHSLAHAIVRRLSFDAGYSASSIRERIYASTEGPGMCGILLYTADGDSEGSLGGLVRMGESERFGGLLQSALQDIAWCSADPVCRETDSTGIDGLNAASCHACILVSETSCSYNNCGLDRRTLVGIGDVKPFFDVDAFAFPEER